MRRTLLIALVTSYTTACFSDVPSGLSASTGRYQLSSVNGAPLPATLSSSGGTKTEIVDETMSLYVGDTYAINGNLRVTTNGQVTTSTRLETGTFSLFGRSGTFRTSDGATTRMAILTSRTITFVENGVTLVYSR